MYINQPKPTKTPRRQATKPGETPRAFTPVVKRSKAERTQPDLRHERSLEPTIPSLDPVPELSPALKANLANCADDAQRVEIAANYIMHAIEIGGRHSEIEKRLGIELGSLDQHVTANGVLRLRYVSALSRRGETFARVALEELSAGRGKTRDSQVRIAICAANTYRSDAEHCKRMAEELLRKVHVVNEIVEYRVAADKKAARKARGSFAAFTPATSETPPTSKFEGFARDPLASLRPSRHEPTNPLQSHTAEAQPDPAELLRRMSIAELQAARVKLKGQIVSHQMAGEPWDHLKPFVTIMKAELAARKEVPATP